MTPYVEGAGVELAWEETGSGAEVVLVHGLAGGRSAWWDVVEQLDGRVRAISYDRRGYGESGAPEPYTGTTVQEQAEDAAALIRAVADGPVMLCGHSFAGPICIDLMLRHRDLVNAAVLLEPALLSLSPHGREEAGELREALLEGANAEGPPGMVDALLRLYGGDRVYELIGEQRAAGARETGVSLAADLVAANAWSFGHGDLRSIDVPAIVVRGSRSRTAWREVAEALAEHLAAGELREADSSHFIPFEDPATVAKAITDLA